MPSDSRGFLKKAGSLWMAIWKSSFDGSLDCAFDVNSELETKIIIGSHLSEPTIDNFDKQSLFTRIRKNRSITQRDSE
jgi:hypothetical protein